MSNYVNWLDRKRVEITDKFARDALIKYLIESFSRDGPEYSVSNFPYWLEDLDEQKNERGVVIPEEQIQRIESIFQAEFTKLKKESLNNLREYFPKKGKRFKGRNITFDGEIKYTQDIIFDGMTVDEYKEEIKDEKGITDKEKLKKFIQNAKEEISEAFENKIKTGEIYSYSLKTDGKKLITVTKEKFEDTDRLENIEDNDWVKEFIGFDSENEEKVSLVLGEAKEAREFLDEKLNLDPNDLEIDFKTEAKGSGQRKYIFTIEGDIDANIDAGKKFSKYGTIEIAGRRGEEGTDLVEDMTFDKPKKLIISQHEGPFSLQEAGEIFTKTDAQFENWFVKNYKDIIFATLLQKGLFNLKFSNDIKVGGIVSLEANEDRSYLKTTFNYSVETQEFFKIRGGIARKAKRQFSEKDLSETGESKVGGDKRKITASFQFKILLYNPLRKDFSEHISARFERLKEVGLE